MYQAIDEYDKNHTESDMEAANQARMYEVPDSEICPVKMYQLYISKLNPQCEDLWQNQGMSLKIFNTVILFGTKTKLWDKIH